MSGTFVDMFAFSFILVLEMWHIINFYSVKLHKTLSQYLGACTLLLYF